MALEYFLYTTEYSNTLIERSNNSFAPLPPNTGEIHIDYFIPNYQPLYYYRESGGTIVINSEANINAYLQGTAPAPQPEDSVEQQQFTGYTATTTAQIQALSAGTVIIDTIISVAPSGASYTSIQAAIDSVTDASTTKRYLIDVYNGNYYEDITMKNYVFVKGNSASNVKIYGDLTIAPFGFGFTKVSEVEFSTTERPTVNINTIGLAQLNSVVLSSTWTGNTLQKSTLNVQRGVVQVLSDSTTMRLTDTYTGATQTSNYIIRVSGSNGVDLNTKNTAFLMEVDSNIAELGLIKHTNTGDSDVGLSEYGLTLNLHGSNPTNTIKLTNLEGAGGEIESTYAITYIDSDNAATPTIISSYGSGNTVGSYIDYTSSKLDWSDNISDENIYIGAAVTGDDGIRVLNVVFETEGDTIPDLYTVDGNAGNHHYSIYNGVGTSYNSETTITSSLIIGNLGDNTIDGFNISLDGSDSGTLVSELGIRNFASDPANIIYSNTGWTGTTSTVEGYLDETTHVLDSITPTGYIYSGSPVLRTGALEITVFAGDGFIVNNETLKHVTWSGQTIDTTVFALGQWYIYVDANGVISTSQSELDLNQYIKIGSFLQISGLSASVLGSGRNIENFGTKVMDNFDRTTAFIYDRGGKVSVTGTTSVMIEFPPLKVQYILDSYDITETVYSTQGATKFFTWFNTVDAGWIQNYDLYRHAGGEVNLRLWNDTSGVSNYEITGGSLTFTSGSTVVTAGFDLSTELIVGYYIYLQTDGITHMNRIDGITGTTLTLAHTYDGSSGSGTALAVTALLPVPTDKYIKHLVYRDFNGIADLVYNDTYQDNLNDIKSEERFLLPGSLGESVVRLAEIISTASELSFEVYLNDVRPIPHGDYAQTASIENVNIHGELAGLTADDHLQYSRTDGTRDITGIQSYDNNKTFTSDTNLITKKFVDDKKYDTSVITGGTFNIAQIPDLNASKISGGTLLVSTIPDLNASIITGGTFNDAQIPDLNASKITGGTFIDIVTPSITTAVIKPSGDTTTALRITNATGGTIVNFDTVSGLTGYGTDSPQGLIHAYGTDSSDGDLWGIQSNSIIIDGDTDVDKNLVFSDNGIPKWAWQTFRDEDGEFIYLYGTESQNQPLTVMRTGRIGVNKNTNILGYHGALISGSTSVLSDLEVSGVYDENYDTVYQVRITATGATDSFDWRTSIDNGITYGSWSATSGVTTTPTELSHGVNVQWGAVNGHTIGTAWEFGAFSQIPKATFSVAPMQWGEVLHTNDYTVPTITYSDYTSAANGGLSTITFPIFQAGSTTQAFYWGTTVPIHSIFINLNETSTSVILIVEYYDGSNWIALDFNNNHLIDYTNNLSVDGQIIWSVASMPDWVLAAIPDGIHGAELYWMRIRTSTSPTTTITANNISIGNDKRFSVYSAHNDYRPSMYVNSNGATNIGGGSTSRKNLLQINEGNFLDVAVGSGSIFETDATDPAVADHRIKLVSEDACGTGIVFVKTRGNLESTTTVLNGDELGHLWWRAKVGTTPTTGATLTSIIAQYTGDGTYTSLKGDLIFNTANGAVIPIERVRITSSGTTGFGESTPTGLIHMGAGTATIAPLKFNSGTSLGSPQEGAVEFDGNAWYGTVTGDTRKTFAFLEAPQFTGDVNLPSSTCLNAVNLIDYITNSGGTSNSGLVTTTDFNTYTGDTDTRFTGIDNDITYISGVTDTKLPITTFNAYTGGTIAWDKVNKTGSDLADLATRNASDVNYTEANWEITNVADGLNKVTDYIENTQGSGRISPTDTLSGLLTGTVQVSGGTGYITYENFYKKITWSSTGITLTGNPEGLLYVYVDTDGDVNVSDTPVNVSENILLGVLYWNGVSIGTVSQSGNIISNSTDRINDFLINLGYFIYDDGGKIGLLSGSTLKITSPQCKIQVGALQVQLEEIDATDSNTFKYRIPFYSADIMWSPYRYMARTGGVIPTDRWNDTTQNGSESLSAYTLTFTNGSAIVSSVSDLSSVLSSDDHLYLEADGVSYEVPISGVSWSGSLTTITLEATYLGAGGSGTAIVNRALPKIPSGKFAKTLVSRTTDNVLAIILSQEYFNAIDEALSGTLPGKPEPLKPFMLNMAYMVYSGSTTDLTGSIYDIRPLPFQLREGGQTGGGSVITVHANLTGLGSDDHLQYLRTDGTRNITGIQRYQSQPTFTTDLDVITKKYSDDQDALKLNITTFNAFSANTYTNSVIDAYTGATDTRLQGIEGDITYLSGQTDTKLAITDFNSWSGTTLPANYYNKTEINAYTGATATAIGNKQDTITGAATTITNTDLTTNRALISSVGKVAVSTVTSTELSYVGGVTSAIQTQLGNKANLAGGAAFTGVITVPKPAQNDNTTCVATTSWYISQAGTANPLVNNSVNVGTSNLFSRQDHVHPIDTSRLAVSAFNTYSGTTASAINLKAPLASPALTGTPTTPTASVDTNTTQIASTAFVLGQAGTANPLMNGTVAVGTSTRYSRQDHVHASDTSKANLASPAFTGTPTAPTAAIGTNTTQIATTAYYIGSAANANPLVNGTVAIGTSTRFARQDHVHATDTSRQATITGAATTITASNLTADRVLISNGTGKIAVSTVTSTDLATAIANVYGTQFQYAQSLAASTSSSTTPVTKVTLTTSTLPAGTYRISANWIASHSSGSNSALFDVTLNGTPLDVSQITVEYKDTTDYVPMTRVYYQTISGVNTILLRYWNESNDTTISDATLELIRVS